MTIQTMLRQLVTERRTAINKTRYTPIRSLPAKLRAAVRRYQTASRALSTASEQLREAGFEAPQGRRATRVQHNAYPRTAQHTKLNQAHQRASLGLLEATTGAQRAAVLKTFIAETKELMQ